MIVLWGSSGVDTAVNGKNDRVTASELEA